MTSNRSANLLRHAARWAPVNVLHGPLNAELAAETVASTSWEEATSTDPMGRWVLGDVTVIRVGGWESEEVKWPFM